VEECRDVGEQKGEWERVGRLYRERGRRGEEVVERSGDLNRIQWKLALNLIAPGEMEDFHKVPPPARFNLSAEDFAWWKTDTPPRTLRATEIVGLTDASRSRQKSTGKQN